MKKLMFVILFVGILSMCLAPTYASYSLVGYKEMLPIAVVFSHSNQTLVLDNVSAKLLNGSIIRLSHYYISSIFEKYQFWISQTHYNGMQLEGVMFQVTYKNGTVSPWYIPSYVYIGRYYNSFAYYIYWVFV